MRKIKYIIIHHSLSQWGDNKALKQWARERGWDRNYHIAILNGYPKFTDWKDKKYKKKFDGKVERLLSEATAGIQCKYANANSLAVCLIGNFDIGKPSQAQWDACKRLVRLWLKKYNLKSSNVYGHGEMMKKIGKEGYVKTCPGKKFSMAKFRRGV